MSDAAEDVGHFAQPHGRVRLEPDEEMQASDASSLSFENQPDSRLAGDGIGPILNYVPGSAGEDVAKDRFWEYEDKKKEKKEFDGVFEIENVNASDPAVVHKLLKDIPLV